MDLLEEIGRINVVIVGDNAALGRFDENMKPLQKSESETDDVTRARTVLGYRSDADVMMEKKLENMKRAKTEYEIEAKKRRKALEARRGHLKKMKEVGVTPYTAASVDKYMASERRKLWWKKCFSANLITILLTCTPLILGSLAFVVWRWVSAGEAVGELIGIVIATFFIQFLVIEVAYMEGFCGFYRCGWRKYHIKDFRGYVPDETLIVGARLQEKLGGKIFVCSLERWKPEVPQKIYDPFLLWEPGGSKAHYTVWHWDEPKFKVELD